MADVFRKEQKALNTPIVEHINSIKSKAEELLHLMNIHPEMPEGDIQVSRELSVAKTKLEEAVMWATKHWTA